MTGVYHDLFSENIAHETCFVCNPVVCVALVVIVNILLFYALRKRAAEINVDHLQTAANAHHGCVFAFKKGKKVLFGNIAQKAYRSAIFFVRAVKARRNIAAASKKQSVAVASFTHVGGKYSLCPYGGQSVFIVNKYIFIAVNKYFFHMIFYGKRQLGVTHRRYINENRNNYRNG